MPDAIPIGQLRWPVNIYQRVQTPQTGGTSITETDVLLAANVRAKIEALRPLTFWTAASGVGEQIDAPVTHMIWLRWINYPPTTWMITRSTLLPDQSCRLETFRVRRVTEMGGRKRMLQLEAELERSESPTTTAVPR